MMKDEFVPRFSAFRKTAADGYPTLCGAIWKQDSCGFRVWAPLKKSMRLHLLDPDEQIVMEKDRDGYYTTVVSSLSAGRRYYFIPDDGDDLPDPVSFYQPESVHGPSQVVDHDAFRWTDNTWRGIPFRELVLYELHVGTFTDEGTFDAIIPRLDDLLALGINALELMPVAQFPGERNWGYDGVFPYAVQNTYGGPDSLKRLVDACHAKGLAVFLDVVYNHLGPEGNCLLRYGPYFTNKYCTPWGDAINFDDAWCDGVREYFVNNALYWLEYFHIDGLRLDAVHMVFDNGAVHFWQYLADRVKQLQERLGRPLHLIAESDLNSPRVVNPPSVGGYGFTAQWLDDFHHALYVMLHQKGRERYADFGRLEQVAKALKEGFVHSGEFVKFRKRRHGASSAGIPGDRFVAFTQNHDQVGNRPLGERLSALIDRERLKVGVAALLLAPYVPMLFMGEEYGDPAPFFYFVSHTDPALIEAVRKGRKEEFKDYKTEGEPPDPQLEKTFTDSKLNWALRENGAHRMLRNWYGALLRLRKEIPSLRNFDKNNVRVQVIADAVLVIGRKAEREGDAVTILLNFSEDVVPFVVHFDGGSARKVLDSREGAWSSSDSSVMASILSDGEKVSLSPLTACVYHHLT